MGNTPLGVLCSANFFGIIQSSGSTVSLNLFPSARRIGSIRKASQRPPPPSLPRSPTSLLLLPLSLLSRDGGLLFSGSSAESASGGTLDAPCFSRWRKPTPSPVAPIALASCTLSCFGGPVGEVCRMPARFRRSRKLGLAGWVCAVPLAFGGGRKLGISGWSVPSRSFSALPKTRRLGLRCWVPLAFALRKLEGSG